MPPKGTLCDAGVYQNSMERISGAGRVTGWTNHAHGFIKNKPPISGSGYSGYGAGDA